MTPHSMERRDRTHAPVLATLMVALSLSAGVFGQATPPPAEAPGAPAGAATPQDAGADTRAATDAPSGPLAPLAWLEGCWQGSVNQREFRETWLPLRGGMLIGAGQSVMLGRMLDYQYLRLEARSDGIYFTQFSGDRKESSFKLAGTATDDKDTVFTFSNTAEGFPARLTYRRGTLGWLYETIEGTLNGSERKVVYPMRRINCQSGELIAK